MALTASPSDAPGARLNEMVAAGNWPWWLMVRGALVRSILAIEVNGTSEPPAVLATPALANCAAVPLVPVVVDADGGALAPVAVVTVVVVPEPPAVLAVPA